MKTVFSAWFSASLAALMLVSAGPVRADGVREINQACVPGGCFAGDNPGFPVEIVASGAYRLSSNLTTGLNETTIDVNTSDVDLDLNGFAIFGPNTCTDTGSAITCAFSSGATLVEVRGANNIVHDGTIRGAEGDGLGLFGQGLIARNVRVSHSGGNGINTSLFVRVSDCSAMFNRMRGFWGSGSATRFDRNYVARNGAVGIQTGSCQDNTSTGNYSGNFSCTTDLGGNSQ